MVGLEVSSPLVQKTPKHKCLPAQLFLCQLCCPQGWKAPGSPEQQERSLALHPPVTVPLPPSRPAADSPAPKSPKFLHCCTAHPPHTPTCCTPSLACTPSPRLIPQLLQEESGCNRDYNRMEA